MPKKKKFHLKQNKPKFLDKNHVSDKLNFFSKFSHDQEVKTLAGTFCPFHKCVAYCLLHKIFLTPKQLKTKGCLVKACAHLKKIPCKKYWDEREKKKMLKHEKKKQLDEVIQTSKARTDKKKSYSPIMNKPKSSMGYLSIGEILKGGK